MKIRSDYVSNSSSSSFIVPSCEAAKKFYEDFNEYLNEYEPMGESMRVSVHKIGDDKWNMQDLNDYVKSDEYVNSNGKFDNIDFIWFDCDDYDSTGTMFLNLLYRYFEKNGFKPDDSESENEFRTTGSSTMLMKLFKLMDKEGDEQ